MYELNVVTLLQNGPQMVEQVGSYLELYTTLFGAKAGEDFFTLFWAIGFYKILQLGFIGIIGFNMSIVQSIGTAPYRIRFCKQPARIQCKYFSGQLVAYYFMRNHLVFVTKAGGKSNLSGILCLKLF